MSDAASPSWSYFQPVASRAATSAGWSGSMSRSRAWARLSGLAGAAAMANSAICDPDVEAIPKPSTNPATRMCEMLPPNDSGTRWARTRTIPVAGVQRPPGGLRIPPEPCHLRLMLTTLEASQLQIGYLLCRFVRSAGRYPREVPHNTSVPVPSNVSTNHSAISATDRSLRPRAASAASSSSPSCR